MAFLRIHLEDGRRFRDVVLDGKRTVIGRAFLADIRLENPAVPRRHSTIVELEDCHVIEDFNSRAGTHVNGELIRRPARLEDGDRLRIGPTHLTYLVDDAQAETLPTGLEVLRERALVHPLAIGTQSYHARFRDQRHFGEFLRILRMPDRSCVVLAASVPDVEVAVAVSCAITRSLSSQSSLADAITAASHAVLSMERIATASLFRVTQGSATVDFVSAGYVTPFVRTADGTPEMLPQEFTGLPLGLDSEWTHVTHSIPLAPPTLLLAMSDDVAQATDAEGRIYHTRGLARHLGQRPADVRIASSISAEVRQFTRDGRSVVHEGSVVCIGPPGYPVRWLGGRAGIAVVSVDDHDATGVQTELSEAIDDIPVDQPIVLDCRGRTSRLSGSFIFVVDRALRRRAASLAGVALTGTADLARMSRGARLDPAVPVALTVRESILELTERVVIELELVDPMSRDLRRAALESGVYDVLADILEEQGHPVAHVLRRLLSAIHAES